MLRVVILQLPPVILEQQGAADAVVDATKVKTVTFLGSAVYRQACAIGRGSPLRTVQRTTREREIIQVLRLQLHALERLRQQSTIRRHQHRNLWH
ncbi:hypothetical protein D3C81_1747770 [compost metagenome]